MFVNLQITKFIKASCFLTYKFHNLKTRKICKQSSTSSLYHSSLPPNLPRLPFLKYNYSISISVIARVYKLALTLCSMSTGSIHLSFVLLRTSSNNTGTNLQCIASNQNFVPEGVE